LGEALDASAGMLVNVEIKNLASDGGFDPTMAVVVDTVAVLRDRGAAERPRWLVSSFSLATIERLRAEADDIATAWLTVLLDDRVVDRIAAAGHLAVHPYDGVVTAPIVERCHQAGLAVHVWTVNDPARIVDLAAMGVDAVCTDVPDVARRALGMAPLGATGASSGGSSGGFTASWGRRA
jgi:glycerophosphoryl diester phosphodiesterase